MSAEARAGGRGEIRTHEGAKPPAGFQDRCLKPLGHPSKPIKRDKALGLYVPEKAFCYPILPPDSRTVLLRRLEGRVYLCHGIVQLSGLTCEYRLKVMSTLEWPRHFKSGVNLGVCRRRLFVFSLRRGHAEKCKAGRTTDLPALRHGLGIGGWCGQPKGPSPSPSPEASAENNSALPWPRHIGRGVGAILFPQRTRYSRREVAKKPPQGR